MDGDNRLKLIIAGLFLAAIAVGYLIFSQRFTSPSTQTANNRSVVQASPTPVSTLAPTDSLSPSSDTLRQSTPGTTKGGLPATGISALPATGAPAGLLAIFSLSAALGGYFLRRYPH